MTGTTKPERHFTPESKARHLAGASRGGRSGSPEAKRRAGRLGYLKMLENLKRRLAERGK